MYAPRTAALASAVSRTRLRSYSAWPGLMSSPSTTPAIPSMSTETRTRMPEPPSLQVTVYSPTTVLACHNRESRGLAKMRFIPLALSFGILANTADIPGEVKRRFCPV
jgi:hypothetical protein